MTVILDTATKGANTTITSDVIVGATANTFEGARADTIKSAGKFVFEVAPALGSLAVDTGFGITSVATPNTGVAPNYQSIASTGDDSLIVFRSGTTKRDGTSLASNVGINGNTIMFAIDLDNNLAWILVTELAGWNNDVTANPATGVGGFDISSIVGAGVYPVGVITSLANGGTFNFGASLFVHELFRPPLFAPWDEVPPPVPDILAFQLIRMAPFGSRITATAAGPPNDATWATTERRDTFAATGSPVNGAALDNTEQTDVFAVEVAVSTVPRGLDDGDIIYVPGPEPTLFVQGDQFHSPFVIPSEDTMMAIPFSER